ncbi:MAG: integrase arm-type DNA-binding domain-containing protein [Sulfuricellaceae bacterium]|nr:integrase arm-type DNA-binding domain-containing protein [Sulfuricellaceae bacterium]
MVLTAIKVKTAKSTDKPLKLSDGGGLYIFIQPNDSKYWRLAYRFDGKQKTLALGVYPDVSLLDARERRDEARKLLAAGTDPGMNKKATKAAGVTRAANSFEVVAREWLAKMNPEWADTHHSKIKTLLENDVFPWLGGRPIADLTPMEILATLTRISDRGAKDTAKRAQQNCGAIFRFAIQTGRAQYNPIPDLRGALPTAIGKHFPAITEPSQVGELLRAIDGFNGTFIVKCALLLSPFFFVRPGELRQARWADFDLDKGEWRFLVSKTKTTEAPRIHIVPLANQAVLILRDLHALTGQDEFVFPGARSNGCAMSDAWVMSATCPPVRINLSGNPRESTAACILHTNPPRDLPSDSSSADHFAAPAAQACARASVLSIETS